MEFGDELLNFPAIIILNDSLAIIMCSDHIFNNTMFAGNLPPEKLSYSHLREGRLCPCLRGDKLWQVSLFPAKVDSRLRGNDKQKVKT